MKRRRGRRTRGGISVGEQQCGRMMALVFGRLVFHGILELFIDTLDATALTPHRTHLGVVIVVTVSVVHQTGTVHKVGGRFVYLTQLLDHRRAAQCQLWHTAVQQSFGALLLQLSHTSLVSAQRGERQRQSVFVVVVVLFSASTASSLSSFSSSSSSRTGIRLLSLHSMLYT